MTGKILIVDDAKANRMVLRALLEKDYYTIYEAEDGLDALEKTEQKQPDLILLDIMMPHLDGFETCKRLKSSQQTANIPVVMITSSENLKEKNQGLAVGADDFLSKPINQDVLFARVRNLLRVKRLMDELLLRGETAKALGIDGFNFDEFERRKQSILVAASNEETAKIWQKDIEEQGHYKINIANGEEDATKIIASGDFDALVVAENLAKDGIGMRLIANLRANWINRDLTILFVAQSGTKAGLRALEFGSNDYMLEPLDAVELATRLRTQTKRIFLAKSLRDQVSKHLRLSVIDPLTELHNRRYFDDYLPKALKRAQRDQTNICLMILDLDHFKSLNDNYGHDFGDKVLVEFASRAKENLRAADMIVRFGGEEFVVITPSVSKREAEVVAERLRKLVALTPFENMKGDLVDVTLSLGATMIEPGEEDIPAILKRADNALYYAKENGRNMVHFDN